MTSPNPPKAGSPFKGDDAPPSVNRKQGAGRPSRLKQSAALQARGGSIWDLANPKLRDITVYEPGKPIEETARELDTGPDAIIKLASNENPLGPSPRAIEAMRSALAMRICIRMVAVFTCAKRSLPSSVSRRRT